MQFLVSITIVRSLKTSETIEKRRMFWIVVDGVRIATFSTLGRHESHEREIDAVNKGGFSVDLEIVLISKRKSKKLSTTFK